MEPHVALGLLGVSRVIWIDDHFSEETPTQLGELLAQHLEISRECEFDGLAQFFDRIDDGDDNAIVDLQEHLAAMLPAEREAISKAFFEKQKDSPQFVTDDLRNQQIQQVCEQLKIADVDRWPFDGADERIAELCAAGDGHISYIVDLHDAYGADANTRGLDILKALHNSDSKGTAFLLTHEASASTEATKETELRAALIAEDETITAAPMPICVIAKERLEGDENNAIANGLRVAIKRAGLRRGIHEVLLRAESQIMEAFSSATDALLTIPPEQLDEYVVSRAVSEGISELHVVERALTATMSESVRKLFATDSLAQQSAVRLRALQAVTLPTPEAPHSELEEFRRKEIWEPGDLVNASFSALACGDVFEFSADEGLEDPRRFILLVQPCDVMIRPKGTRDAESGFLVPLKQKQGGGKDSLKQPSLPFKLDHKDWVCDFRAATSVRLDTLDLATLRADGKVRYDKEQALPKAILPGQELSGKKLLKKLGEALNDRAKQKGSDKNLFDVRCILTLATSGVFKEVAQPTFTDPSKATGTQSAKGKKADGKAAASKSEHSTASDHHFEKETSADSKGAVVIDLEIPPIPAAKVEAGDSSSVVTQLAAVPVESRASVAGNPAEDTGINKVDPQIKASDAAPVKEVARLSWRIRRCGRVRMPFAASLLNSYLSVMGREAFDLDYLKPSAEECQIACSVPDETEATPAAAAA